MTHTAEIDAWRTLIPEAVEKIANFHTAEGVVGEGLAEVLAVRVLNVAYQHRTDLARVGAAVALDQRREAVRAALIDYVRPSSVRGTPTWESLDRAVDRVMEVSVTPPEVT